MSDTLESEWTIYYHHNDNPDWSMNGYKKIGSISTIQEYFTFIKNIPKFRGILFIMRGDILPLWEEPQNKNGGAFTLFFSDNEYHEYIERTSMYMVSEQLTTERKGRSVNGISVTSKHNSYSLKIWINDNKFSKTIQFNKSLMFAKLSYKSHFKS
jgi:hypothetical protein